MNRGTTALSRVYRGSTVINKIYRGTQLLWEYWAYMTGSLWTTRNTLASWALGVTADSGVKATPVGVKPITLTIQVVGNQQDGSGQQMQRKITAYRKSDNVAVVLYDYTSGLGPSINVTNSVTIAGDVEYNRIVGYCSGKLASGSYVEVKITEWKQKD